MENLPWTTVSVDRLMSATPWRTFRWHRGQKHYSGSYWSATMRRPVIYESRLELARLLFADFDPHVHGIVAQPFLMKTVAGAKARSHIPDYLLITDQGPVVVDVKPHRLLTGPEVAFTFEWTRRAVESRGWRYEVWSEPPEAELENIRFLAGFRRSWLFAPNLLDDLRLADLDGLPLGTAAGQLPRWPEPRVRAALHHLLWTHELRVDLGEPLATSRLLRRTA
ncbi:TnsA-like heteromeric transposase endonuclease subunit [Streptomyces sp. V4I2]|uniref:TnsA-like heteromeric transposase endonuclease subunit n=1 Tax=Streptomyces sp. V4I2 TaxID=3042280 RepID=UPI0027D88E9E|nr:TnsA-like heteromeric transposase endonuclease subunit [Streptomyces sp. V4I2]